jgi:hypothetical protein
VRCSYNLKFDLGKFPAVSGSRSPPVRSDCPVAYHSMQGHGLCRVYKYYSKTSAVDYTNHDFYERCYISSMFCVFLLETIAYVIYFSAVSLVQYFMSKSVWLFSNFSELPGSITNTDLSVLTRWDPNSTRSLESMTKYGFTIFSFQLQNCVMYHHTYAC